MNKLQILCKNKSIFGSKQLLTNLPQCTRGNSTSVEAKVQNKKPHTPVMLNQVLKFLKPQQEQTIIDMTFGAGGHSQAILEEAPGCKVIALDRDPIGYEYALKLQELYPDRVFPLLGKFSELPSLLKTLNMGQNSIDGALFDFGCSSMQFNTPSRGFAVSTNGPLDMRMDYQRFPDSPTAKDILARASEEDLMRIFKVYGGEKNYRQIAGAIVQSRYLFRKLETTQELGDLINSVCGEETRVDKLNRPTHTATKVFQALRIFVNNELNEINYGMLIAQKYLKLGGRLVTLSFHSLEDTIVKRHILGNLVENVANPLPLKYANHSLIHEKEVISCLMESNWESLTRHVVIPSFAEIEENPRSRSAKLRAAIKVK